MGFANYQNVCVFVISDRVCYGQWLVDTVGSAAAGWRGLAVSADCLLWMQFGPFSCENKFVMPPPFFFTTQRLLCARYNGTDVSVH